MKNSLTALMALAPLWPIASYAGGIDIPQLGVHIGISIVQAPDNAPITPQVIRRFDGYEAILPLGIATLEIARVDDPVPLGGDIRNAAFRAIQQAEFYEQPDLTAHEQATTVAGRDAWSITTVRSGGPLTVNYRCVTYTIVDQHLYRLVAYATGNDKRPPDYETAVRVMAALTFVPLDQSSLPDTGTVTGLLKMPKPQISKNRDFYPPPAKRRGEEGVVDIEYSIDSKGRVRDIKETSSASRTLQEAAQVFLTSATFKVKPSWEEDGYQKLRFTTEVQFWLGRCPRNSPAHTLGAELVTICASIMPR